MRSLLFVSAFLVVACGGSSRSQSGSRGDESNGGRGGNGGGGTAGAAGTAAASGSAGVATGASGGTGARGGTAGEAGDPGMPDAGESSGGAGNGGTSGTDPGGSGGAGATPSITSCTESFRFLGAWQGNVLDFYFEPMEAIRLVVTADEENGGYQGTMEFGSGDPPPPVTSGDEPWPDLEFWNTVDDLDPLLRVEPWPGFVHTVVRGAACDDVLRVSIAVSEPWNEWCSLQEPVYTDGSGWNCTYRGNGGFTNGMCTIETNNGQSIGTYPIWKCLACGAVTSDDGFCACSERGCTFNRNATHTYDFNLVEDGVISGPDPKCSDCTVRLERVE